MVRVGGVPGYALRPQGILLCGNPGANSFEGWSAGAFVQPGLCDWMKNVAMSSTSRGQLRRHRVEPRATRTEAASGLERRHGVARDVRVALASEEVGLLAQVRTAPIMAKNSHVGST